MEIFDLENNTGASPGQKIEEQVNFVVHGFVTVWNQFEDSLATELAAASGPGRLEKPDSRLSHDLLFRVGIVLNSSPSLTMGELSKALAVPLSTATRFASLLVDQGYVRRLPDQADRRIVRIGFTPEGRELYRFIYGYITERVRKIASYLTEAEMTALITLLNKVAFAVKETLK